MKRYLPLMIVLLASAGFGQDRPKLIGEIEFFGYSGVDLQRIKAALPFHEGEGFDLEPSRRVPHRPRKPLKRLPAMRRLTSHKSAATAKVTGSSLSGSPVKPSATIRRREGPLGCRRISSICMIGI
jgi:hypothetical protein